MALVIADRVRETSTTTGTGTLTLDGAVSGYQTFSTAIGNTNTCYYTITLGSAWEIGIGTVSAGQLARTTVLKSSNSGAAVDFGAGAKDVFATYAGDKAVDTDIAQTLTNKTISTDSNTINGIAASSFVLSNASGVIDGSAAQKAIPTGAVVGTSDAQTLTGKTLTDPAIIGTILEDVFTITDGAAFEIDPGNGSIQLITLGASRTPKATNFVAGESVTLMVDDGTAYTLTWSDSTFGGSGVVWKTDSGSAPTLNTTGYTVIVLWKVSTQVYGARVGNN
jgi:hypothetical protein